MKDAFSSEMEKGKSFERTAFFFYFSFSSILSVYCLGHSCISITLVSADFVFVSVLKDEL